MSIESFLTRELNICFLDARNIVLEARVALGVVGYPTKLEKRQIRRKAMEIFECLAEEEKSLLGTRNLYLNEAKMVSLGLDGSSFRSTSGNEDDCSYLSSLE